VKFDEPDRAARNVGDESSDDDRFDDAMFDSDAVERGAWACGPYGAGDERGSFNEVTPEKTARALRLLEGRGAVRTYSLGEELFEGFPAWGDREFRQTLVTTGYRPAADFAGRVTDTNPQGTGRSSVNEERVSFTFNMGSKINGLHHVGVGDQFYNGFSGSDFARTGGTTHLGAETMGPIVTRGVVLDIVGWKLRTAGSDVERASSGRPVLRENYRITLDDIKAVIAEAGLSEPIGPGDVVLFNTGWRELIADDPRRYLDAGPPGPYLRECRWLAERRPAIVASDTWCFEVIDPAVTHGYLMPCHQELSMRSGIRIGEAIAVHELAAEGVAEFVFCFNPLAARGAVGGIGPPIALVAT
jgi:kynurenine formamidase